MKKGPENGPRSAARELHRTEGRLRWEKSGQYLKEQGEWWPQAGWEA